MKTELLPTNDIVGSGADFLEPQPPLPPPLECEHVCSSCGRQIIDGKWTCCCRGMHMLLMAMALGAGAAVMVWALRRGVS